MTISVAEIRELRKTANLVAKAGLTRGMRLLGAGATGAATGVAGAGTGAVTGAIGAEKGKRWQGAARGAAVGGVLGAGLGAGAAYKAAPQMWKARQAAMMNVGGQSFQVARPAVPAWYGVGVPVVGATGTAAAGYAAGRTARGQQPVQKYAHVLPTNENVVVPRILADKDDIDGDHRSWASPGDPDHLPAENRPTCAALSQAAEDNARHATEGQLKRYLAMGKRPLRREPNTDLQFLIRESTKQKTAGDADTAAGIGAATGGFAGGGAGLMAGYNAAKSKTPKPSWITRKLNPEGSLVPTSKAVSQLRKSMTRGGVAGAATGAGLGALAGLGAHLALRNDGEEKLAFIAGYRAKKRFALADQGGSGSVKHEYLLARDRMMGYPKPGNVSYFKKFDARARKAGYPVEEWQATETENAPGLLGFRRGGREVEKKASFDPTAAYFRHVENNLQRTFLRR